MSSWEAGGLIQAIIMQNGKVTPKACRSWPMSHIAGQASFLVPSIFVHSFIHSHSLSTYCVPRRPWGYRAKTDAFPA
jgi:hypothetical protein